MTAPILVTGAAGFIGYHVARRLLADGHAVVGLDNLNAYYDPALKKARLAELATFAAFRFEACDLADRAAMAQVFSAGRFADVVHLGAQAGVRYSLVDPHAYAASNLVGFLNVLEGCRHHGCRHLLYASSSSVYGANTRVPFKVGDTVDHPLSLYAATKKSNELMAHTYAHLFGLPTTGLRFFTVYGPWGRPDMAPWLFTEAIAAGKAITLFNVAQARRDFTYIDDVVEAVVRLVPCAAQPNPDWSGAAPDPASSRAPWRVYNIGNNRSVPVMDLVRAIERALGKTAICEHLPMQPGDVPETCADVTALSEAVGFRPSVTLEEGVPRFVAWYLDYRRRPA